MKIDPETRHQSLAQHVLFHLSFIDADNVRQSMIPFLLIYDIPYILGLGSILKLEFLWIFLPFIIILHLWGIRLMIKNPYSTQFEMLMFMGGLGLFGAISLFIMVLGMSYYSLHITSLFYYIVISVSTILLVYIFVKYQIDKFSGDPTQERKKSNQSKYMGLLSAAPGLGYLFSISMRDSPLELIFNVLCVYFFAMFLAYFAAKFIHRYFFMKTNMEYVTYQPTTYKKRKKAKKQGIEIK